MHTSPNDGSTLTPQQEMAATLEALVKIHAPKVEMPEPATSGKALRVGLGHAGMSPPI